MTKKTCAACDYPLDPKSTIEVKIGGKTVEVCCEECATKLREASTKARKKALITRDFLPFKGVRKKR